MAKITLGNRPKNFKRTITVPLLDGETGTIEVSYIYRTRTEFGAFVDELLASARATDPKEAQPEVNPEFSLQDALQKTRDTNADYILQIADGWNLDQPFTRANVIQLCDELPGAAMEIINNYRSAVTEGALGN